MPDNRLGSRTTIRTAANIAGLDLHSLDTFSSSPNSRTTTRNLLLAAS
jgi:hypothetical protein